MRKTTEKQPECPAFEELVKLLAIYTDASNRLTEIEVEANDRLLELLDQQVKEYAALQVQVSDASAQLEATCKAHPEWFEKARSIKTPYGKVQFHRSNPLECVNDEATIKLLRAEAKANRNFDAEGFIRTTESPNLEALAQFDDTTLEKFMVKRVTKDNFSATPARVDFGKAVKESVATETAA